MTTPTPSPGVENVMSIAFELARIREEHGAQSGMYLSEVRALRAEVERALRRAARIVCMKTGSGKGADSMTALSDDDRAKVRACADLFFSQTGTVEQNIARVAFAAFHAGRALLAAQPAVQQPAEDAELLQHLIATGRYVNHDIDGYRLCEPDDGESINGPFDDARTAIRSAIKAQGGKQ